MDVRLLEAFRTVVDLRSVTGAASAMGITQPAVSAQIARLEDEVGFPLFERANGRLKPTAEALLFYAEVSKALSGFDRLTQAAEQIRTAQSGRLVVASHPSAAISLLPGIVADFLRERPGVSVRLVTRSSDVISQLLPAESYDLAIAELPIDGAGAALTRYRMRCVAILPAGHALARYDTLTPALIGDQPLVMTSQARQTALRVRDAFATARVACNAVAETEFFATSCGLVAAGAGISFVDPLSAASFAHLGLVTRPFKPAIHYEIGVFPARDREPSVLVEAFRLLLDDHLKTLSD
jgi:DNA-binding transcriptional LysR family regulator